MSVEVGGFGSPGAGLGGMAQAEIQSRSSASAVCTVVAEPSL